MRKTQFNNVEARAVASMLQFAIENELNNLDAETMEDAVYGFTGQIQDWWFTQEPELVLQLQTQINAALEAFFGNEVS